MLCLLAPVCLLTLMWLALARDVRADGSLPPLPYRYLHPPAALKGSNKPPTSGIRLLPADYLRAVVHWAVFTQDGQAGVSGRKGSLAVGRSASDVIIWLDPVDTPPGLPAGVAADGNAYRVSIVQRPGNRPVAVTTSIQVTLVFPHLPIGIYRYASGTWSRLCGMGRAIETGSTITCPARQPGVFVVGTTPSNSSTPMPGTPISSTPFGWINRYIPLIGALVVLLGAAIAAYAVSRPERPSRRDR